MKGYLTLNVLVFDDELKMIAERAQAAEKAGVDALIVQDIGAVKIIREVSSIPVHGSTQMTVTSAEGLLCAADMGIERVVVARELSIEDIAEISEKTRHKNVEVEAFVHGAMCVSYSGQCFSSEFKSGRSANRGQCAQACRLPYGCVSTFPIFVYDIVLSHNVKIWTQSPGRWAIEGSCRQRLPSESPRPCSSRSYSRIDKSKGGQFKDRRSSKISRICRCDDSCIQESC
jgi:collagenase-like PrtC family protease